MFCGVNSSFYQALFIVIIIGTTLSLKYLNVLMVSISCMVLLPAFLSASGLSSGIALVITALIILVYSFIHRGIKFSDFLLPKKILIIIIFLLSIILLHGFVAYFSNISTFNLTRFFSSLLGLLIIILGAYRFTIIMLKASSESTEKIMSLIVILIIITTSLVYIRYAIFSPFFLHNFTVLSVFSEPSLYVITILPFFLIKLVTSSPKNQLIIIFILLSTSLIIRSTTLLIASGIMVIVFKLDSITRKNIFYYLTILLLSILVYINFIHNNLTPLNPIQYFIERITFPFQEVNSATSTSVLYFQKDWHDAFNNLIDTYGIGLGFQQTGIYGYTSHIGEIIHQHIGSYPNKFITVSIAPKIISEFGLLGIVLLLIYLKYFIKSAIYLKASFHSTNRKIMFSEIFYHSFIFTLFIPLFVRGTTYFSSWLFFLLSSIIYFMIYKKNSFTGTD
mgnify:CR=1 FL=1